MNYHMKTTTQCTIKSIAYNNFYNKYKIKDKTLRVEDYHQKMAKIFQLHVTEKHYIRLVNARVIKSS